MSFLDDLGEVRLQQAETAYDFIVPRLWWIVCKLFGHRDVSLIVALPDNPTHVERKNPKQIAYHCDACDTYFKVLQPRDKAGEFSGIPKRRGTAIAISNRGWKLFERIQRRERDS
jgi:hypothetical protein